MNLYHYYHIYGDGEWEEILHEHLTALQTSGLYDSLAAFNIGIVGSWKQRELVRCIIEDHCMRFHVVVEALSGYEQVTIDALALDAKGRAPHDGLLLYGHTKGAAYGSEFQDRWRRFMSDNLVHDWRNVRKCLETGYYDTVGCFLIEDQRYEPDVPVFAGVHGNSTMYQQLVKEMGGRFFGIIDEPQPTERRVHYSGNFWWSTLDWIRRLPYPCDDADRWCAEMWIGRAADGSYPRAVCLQDGSPFEELA